MYIQTVASNTKKFDIQLDKIRLIAGSPPSSFRPCKIDRAKSVEKTYEQREETEIACFHAAVQRTVLRWQSSSSSAGRHGARFMHAGEREYISAHARSRWNCLIGGIIRSGSSPPTRPFTWAHTHAEVLRHARPAIYTYISSIRKYRNARARIGLLPNDARAHAESRHFRRRSGFIAPGNGILVDRRVIFFLLFSLSLALFQGPTQKPLAGRV